jgi:hypothetical protein
MGAVGLSIFDHEKHFFAKLGNNLNYLFKN